ncbi:MAG: DinB family protein [Ignavibacteria bacterium]
MGTLKEQYKLVQSSREAVLRYLETISFEDLTKEVESFNKSSIRKMIMHVANTYVFWFGNFEPGKKTDYYKDNEVKTAADLRKVLAGVDMLVNEFLNRFKDSLNASVEGNIFWLKKNITETPLSLFTHVITHEFHHKGQIMSMSRQLGYTPPDADVIRFS